MTKLCYDSVSNNFGSHCMEWFTWTPLELAANIGTVICIFLAGRNSVHTWWTGIIACILFMILFYSAKLYADVLLQVFFVGTSLIGWYGWSKFKDKPVLKIQKTPGALLLIYGLIAVIVAFVYGQILHKFTDAYAPHIDSLVLTFSVLAQLLLMKRRLENWSVWVLVNILSVPLFWSRELYLTSVLYSVFLVHAIYAAMQWRKEYQLSNNLV